jgi:excisionase family DNA binding protein
VAEAYVGVQELAAELKVSTRTVRRWLRDKKISGWQQARNRGKWRFLLSEVVRDLGPEWVRVEFSNNRGVLEVHKLSRCPRLGPLPADEMRDLPF